jgi:hypothetical protein
MGKKESASASVGQGGSPYQTMPGSRALLEFGLGLGGLVIGLSTFLWVHRWRKPPKKDPAPQALD